MAQDKSRLRKTYSFFRQQPVYASGGDPTNASYVVLTLDNDLTNERRLTAGTGITITDGGAGGNVTITATATGSGDVVGPAMATDDAIVRFDLTTGKLLQNSSVTISDMNDITTPGDVAVNGGDITTTATTFNLINSTATTVNIAGGATTAVTLGGNGGTITIANPTVTLSNSSTLNVNGANPTIAGSSNGTLTLFNTSLTTVNAFGAATTIQIGANTGTTAIKNSLTVDGNTTLGNTNGDSITFTGQVTSNILPNADVSWNLGSSEKRWANIYTGDLHLRNDRGDWTIVEEKDYLCVVNNITGKKYKMLLELID